MNPLARFLASLIALFRQPPHAGEARIPLDRAAGHRDEHAPIHIVSELNIPPAEIERRRANDQLNNSWERWKFAAAITNLVVAIATLAAVAWYASVADRQLGEMRKTTQATLDAINITKQEQRAWVFPVIEEDPKIVWFQRTPIKLELRNVGKSAATDLRFRAGLREFETPPAALKETDSDHVGASVLVPGGSLSIMVAAIEPTRHQDLARKFVIWARLTYTDRFNTSGESYFCRFYDPFVKRFHTCPQNQPWGHDNAK